MSDTLLEQVVNAVLYEGYILYPYRPSSKKNRRERFTFGRIYPEAYSRAQENAEPCLMQTECLVEPEPAGAELEVSVRFLQPMAREVGLLAAPLKDWAQTEPEPAYQVVPELRLGGQLYQTWLEAVEREIRLPLCTGPQQLCQSFSFPAARTSEPIRDPQNQVAALLVRRLEAVAGVVELAVCSLAEGLLKVTVRVLNQTPLAQPELVDADAVLRRTCASTHTVLRVRNGAFVSLLAPPECYGEAAAVCRNLGTWPVLVGDEQLQERHTLLSSPIILYDYPRIAPESPGTWFDGTEVDELLTLRVLTLSPEEKLEMRGVDEQARRLLERTEALPEDALLKLHGRLRPVGTRSTASQIRSGTGTRWNAPLPAQAGRGPEGSSHEPPLCNAGSGDEPSPPRPPQSASAQTSAWDDFFGANTTLQGVEVAGVSLHAGDRVRIRPKARADALDLALAGQTAIIEALEQDLEGRIHLALVLEADPGKDLGLLRQPGHRFFYGLEEVEPLPK